MNQEVLATMFVRLTVDATVNGIIINPTTDTIQFAFILDDTRDPISADWVIGSWETDIVDAISTYYGRCLVGPTGGVIALAVGTYRIWIRISDMPETVVKRADFLKITSEG